MKKHLLLVILISFATISSAQIQSEIATTKYFSFHNNYWVNCHHFLYQKAKGSQLQKLQQDGFEFLRIGETKVIDGFTSKERKKLNKAIQYYKEKLIDKDLLRNLGKVRVALQNQPDYKLKPDTLIGKSFAECLNDFSGLYREKIWPLHKAHNNKTIQKHLTNITLLETTVIATMEKLALNTWPSNLKVRVDLTVYANYAGAYTASRPKMNIVFSTLDPDSNSLGFLETIFHEGSHLLFNYGGTFRDGIYKVYKQNNFSIKYPGNLWHASLFYLCGVVCKKEFEKMGLENYELAMDRRAIFKKYNTAIFRTILDAYLENKITFSETMLELLKDINE